MKNLLFIVFVFVSLGLQAQVECNKTLYDKYMRQGADFVAKEKYMDAVTEYIAALTICPQEVQKIQVELKKVFTKVNQLKDNAQKAEKKAIEAQKATEKALAETEKQKQLALAEAEKAQVQLFKVQLLSLNKDSKTFYDQDKPVVFWKDIDSLDCSSMALKVLMPELEHCTNLSYLTITRNESLEDIAVLGNLKKLSSLDFYGNYTITNFSRIASLKHLKISPRENYNDKLVLKLPDRLTHLDLSQSNLKEYPKIEGGTITHLNLSNNELTTLPNSLCQNKQLVEVNLRANPLYLEESECWQAFLKNTTNLDAEQINYIFRRNDPRLEQFRSEKANRVSIDLFYQIDPAHFLNTPFYRKNCELSSMLINVVARGANVRGFTNYDKISKEIFMERIDKVEVMQTDSGYFYFEIQEHLIYDIISNKVSFPTDDYSNLLYLYYQNSKEKMFIATFPLAEVARLFDHDDMIWVNPLNCTDQRYFDEALINRFYAGKLVGYRDNTKRLSKKVTMMDSLDDIKETYKIYPTLIKALEYEHHFTLNETEKSIFDSVYTIKQGYEEKIDSLKTNRQSIVPLTNLQYELIEDRPFIKLFVQVLDGAVRAGLIRPWEDDSLNYRMPYETYIRNFSKAEKIENYYEKIDIELSVDLFFDRKQSKISMLDFFSQKDGKVASLNLYLPAKYSSTGKKEYITSFALTEIIPEVLEGNPQCPQLFQKVVSKAFQVKLLAYRDPISGRYIENQDLVGLKKALGSYAYATNEITIEGKLDKDAFTLEDILLKDFAYEKVKDLYLIGNDSKELPQVVQKMRNLQKIDLQDNPNLDWQNVLNTLSKIPQKKAFTTKNEEFKKGILWVRIDDYQISGFLAKITPSQIGELKNLTELYWDGNLSNLPSQIGELKNLTKLDLSDKLNLDFADALKKIGELKNLNELNLQKNQLTKLPSQIGGLKNLTKLDLSENQLTALPSQIGDLKNLTWLDLGENQLTELPSQIGGLKNLTELNLFSNKLNTLPSQIGELKNLTELNLTYNDSLDLASLCKAFANFPKKIIIATNIKVKKDQQDILLIEIPEQSKLPSQIGELKNLASLDLRLDNFGSFDLSDRLDWQQISSVLSAMPQKVLFTTDQKQLQTGILWVVIGGKQLFKVLEIAKPEQIENLQNIIGLNLSYKQLSSSVSQIGELKKLKILQELDFRGNYLTSLPSQIGDLENLTVLNLGYNQITSLPLEMGKLKKLKILLLNSNPLSLAEINKTLALLPQLEELYLGDLGLTMLPNAVLGLKNLKKLGLKNYRDKNPNNFSEEEEEKIRKLLPNCEVEF